ncbi:MAG: cellulase family glycosylhydrolase, partial [Chloroflexi bacterium]|nr:cellulase family glycosylhydrolase [Chloroflexota bacterium]
MKAPRKVLVAFALIGLLGAGWAIFAHPAAFYPEPPPTATPWPIPRRVDSPGYGINLHIWWDPWAAVRRDWHLVQDAGFTWVKQRLAWQDIEGAGPGVYEWAAADRIVAEAEEAEVALIFRVDHPPAWAAPDPEEDATGPIPPVDVAAFGDFCHTLADRFRGRVAGYQVWNEPNLAREWGGQVPDPGGYTQLLRACYVGIKRADPEALVISAGLSPTGSGPPHALPDADFLRGM